MMNVAISYAGNFFSSINLSVLKMSDKNVTIKEMHLTNFFEL